MLIENRVGRLLLVEKDPGYAAVWQTALGPDADWLIAQLLALPPRREALRTALASEPTSEKEHAFHTLIESWGYHRARRTKGFGFLADESSRGAGASLARVWKPQEWALRILALQGLRRRITVQQGCGIEAMAAHAGRRDVFVYADPPYPTAGERMYVHGTVDLPALLAGCRQAQEPVVMSCEDHGDMVSQAAALGLDCLRVSMHSATNTQMRELLICNRPLPHEPATMEDVEPAQRIAYLSMSRSIIAVFLPRGNLATPLFCSDGSWHAHAGNASTEAQLLKRERLRRHAGRDEPTRAREEGTTMGIPVAELIQGLRTLLQPPDERVQPRRKRRVGQHEHRAQARDNGAQLGMQAQRRGLAEVRFEVIEPGKGRDEGGVGHGRAPTFVERTLR